MTYDCDSNKHGTWLYSVTLSRDNSTNNKTQYTDYGHRWQWLVANTHWHPTSGKCEANRTPVLNTRDCEWIEMFQSHMMFDTTPQHSHTTLFNTQNKFDLTTHGSTSVQQTHHVWQWQRHRRFPSASDADMQTQHVSTTHSVCDIMRAHGACSTHHTTTVEIKHAATTLTSNKHNT